MHPDMQNLNCRMLRINSRYGRSQSVTDGNVASDLPFRCLDSKWMTAIFSNQPSRISGDRLTLCVKSHQLSCVTWLVGHFLFMTNWFEILYLCAENQECRLWNEDLVIRRFPFFYTYYTNWSATTQSYWELKRTWDSNDILAFLILISLFHNFTDKH